MHKVQTECQSSVGFLKGNDTDFNQAMDSISDMYSDLFKTVDYNEGRISDESNLNIF